MGFWSWGREEEGEMEGKGREEKGDDRRIERARDKWGGEEVRGKRKGSKEIPLW